jgi:hypothetical protein
MSTIESLRPPHVAGSPRCIVCILIMVMMFRGTHGAYCIGPEVHLRDLLWLGPGSRDARSAGAPDHVLNAMAARGSRQILVT